MSKETEINVLVDNVGRTIVGRIKKAGTTVDVENPAIVNIEVRQDTGQIAVQLLPYIFREFVAPEQRTGTTTWKFPKASVVMSSDLKVDDALKQQYKNVYEQSVGSLTPNAAPVATPPADVEEPEVVKLFDD
jgi:hypothetical protein